MGGFGKAHQGVAWILRYRGCVYLERLTPLFGENRPHCARVGVHMLGPAFQRGRSLGIVDEGPSMHGYAFSHWVLQVRDRKRGACGEAIIIHPMRMDTAL